MTNDDLTKLWKISQFTKRILMFVFDEGHCIAQWGTFRKNYLSVGILRHRIGEPIPFYIASATLPPRVLYETRQLLYLKATPGTTKVLCSNDRPDIRLSVRQLAYPASSYNDLNFLIPFNWNEEMHVPSKFLVFFDNIKEVQMAIKHMRSRLNRRYHDRIDWFHSTMTQSYQEKAVERLRSGEVWGLFCTDAFGMVSDELISNHISDTPAGNGHRGRHRSCPIQSHL